MANIALRSPQFKTISTSSGVLSSKLILNINGTVRYTIVKNKVVGADTVFEISELCRDYLEVSYSGSASPITITIITTLQNFSGANGTGTQVGSDVVINDVGWEAYGEYVDGSNPTNPVNRTIPTWLIAPIKTVSFSNNTFEIFAPIGEGGRVPLMFSDGTKGQQSYSGTDIVVSRTGLNEDIKINRIDCNKYGNGREIFFINKYGAQQSLWFSLKETQKISRKNENYKSSTLYYDDDVPYYQISDAPVKTFNTVAKKSYTLNSGYYPEGAVEWFEQLLLSEHIWMKRFSQENPASQKIIPVRLKSSSITLKTSVNDGLINYTMEFEDAFDYINNIR
jgi:hypothetical protein